jgi:glucosylglycerol 3-phosphatase
LPQRPSSLKLRSQHFSLDHELLLNALNDLDHFLLIQDLDGVCMGLVRDPLTRSLSADYIQAAKKLERHFYVLTNGEHIGRRGINSLIDHSVGSVVLAQEQGLYLPGLGGGAVQWQDTYGQVSLPGVSTTELQFLESVPERFRNALGKVLSKKPFSLGSNTIEQLLEVIVLDNLVSPTINISSFFTLMDANWETCPVLQRAIKTILEDVRAQAARVALTDSFFIHYAPNLGTGSHGERVKWATQTDPGTTDFQFMLKGAIKEVGVLIILNRYYYQFTGAYPLGENFNARQAPREIEALVTLARNHFDPALMPYIVGVGDTITSQPNPEPGGRCLRGGSDRGFLTLVQALGNGFRLDKNSDIESDAESGSTVIFVDSSGGELNRPAIDVKQLKQSSDPWPSVRGLSDSDDPLRVNFIFARGHQEYVEFFCKLASRFN